MLRAERKMKPARETESKRRMVRVLSPSKRRRRSPGTRALDPTQVLALPWGVEGKRTKLLSRPTRRKIT